MALAELLWARDRNRYISRAGLHVSKVKPLIRLHHLSGYNSDKVKIKWKIKCTQALT